MEREKNLSASRLGEPKSPLMHQRMLHIEVLWVMEYSDGFIAGLLLFSDRGIVLVSHRGWCILDGSSHYVEVKMKRSRVARKK